MHRFVTARWVVPSVALFAALTACSVALAAPVPPSDFTCGVTVFDQPCNQTAHFGAVAFTGTPFASAQDCPSFVTTDFALITGSGNGAEHSIINNALDGWFTSTFTGTATITAYLDPGLTMPDTAVPSFTGQITEWFGGSFNRNNFATTSTFHFSGTASDDETLRILDISHANSTGNNPFVPRSFEITRCG
jgi:hypothetical protein